MKRLIPAFALVLGYVWASGQAAEMPLTTLRAIHALSNEEANRALPVAFEATVTYFRGYEKTLFVQDGDAAIYVNATTNLSLAPGDRILVRGTTTGSFRPIVVSRDLTLLRHGRLPPPVRASYTAMIRAELDCRYVVVRGRVRTAILSLSSGRPVTQMELQTEGGIVGVTMDSADPNPLRDLLEAEVDIAGSIAGRFDGKMQQTGLQLHATSFDSVKIVRRTPMDPWSLPVTAMDEVLKQSQVDDRSRHVRVEGTLTYYRQTSMAVLQDGNRSIRVQTPQVDRLRIGDRVEAIGIPTVENDFLTLKLGEIRSTGAAAPIVPSLAKWDDIASGKYAFNLVSIDGAVVTQVREHSQDVYIVSAGNHLFSATVRHPFVYEFNVRRDPPPMPPIPSGSRVRVTGVAVLDNGDPFNGAMAFGILLRSADDVAVLAPPPLLNVRNLLLVAGVLLLIVFIVVAREWSLERRVRRETAAAATMERGRSEVLEDINRTRPLSEIIEKITGLLSFELHGAPCWCELQDGSVLGSRPGVAETSRLDVLQRTIPSHAGNALGTIFAAIDPKSRARAAGPEALFNPAQLAALAIETHGLYSDLVHRSEFDLLTDIHNRFSLEKQLDRWIAGERRDDATFGLIYVDLDGFKFVNDQYGHRVGDLYLQEAAARMKRQLRPADMLARLGGDEFAAIVQLVRSRADIAEIAARIEHCFDEPLVLEGYAIRGTASVGIALYPADGTTRDSLLSTADAAMYVTKNTRQKMAAAPVGEEL